MLSTAFTLHEKCAIRKPVIIIDSCVVISWFIFNNKSAECVSQTATAKTIVFCIVFVL